MLLAGDERNRSQRGNNNAYCQDNPMNWIDWQADADAKALIEFTQRLIQLRSLHPVLRRSWYLHGKYRSLSTDLPDVSWLNSSAELMSEADWHIPGGGFVALQLMGDAIPPDVNVQPSDSLLLVFNGGTSDVLFPLSSRCLAGEQWYLELDSSAPDNVMDFTKSHYLSQGKSVTVFRLLT